MQYHPTSLWMSSLADNQTTSSRPSLEQDIDVDVAIVGAGYSGLWAAYYLKQAAPELSIAILEAHQVGFGASGRNGGWLMGAIDGEDALLDRLPFEAKRRARKIIHGIVEEADRVFQKENIDCDFSHGGYLSMAARYPEQLSRTQASLKEYRADGYDENDIRWLDAEEARSRLNLRNTYGALFSPHTARIHPGKLVSELARVVEKLGVTIYENSPVIEFPPKGLRTQQAHIKADRTLICTEGFSFFQPQQRRYILPIQSLIIATDPLTDAQWEEIGLHHNETFDDACRLIIYGQRAADNRLVFGSRGTYQFGGQPKAHFEDTAKDFDAVEALMRDCLPQLGSTPAPHRWGGTLGMPRAGAAHAIFDQQSGIGTIGNYGGEGVGASNLMARTLVDLLLEKTSELTQMPWAHHGSLQQHARRWEMEPLRWLGYRAILNTFVYEESVLSNNKSSTWKRRAIDGLAGAAKKVL